MKRRFLITCATGDIGTALCGYMAEKGHDLMITARDEGRLADLAKELSAKYPEVKVAFCSADLGKPETMDKIITQSKEIGVDGVVLMLPRPPVLAELDPKKEFDVLNKAMQDCFTGPRYFLQRLLPSMEKSDLKSTVLVSGTSSKQPINAAAWEAFNDVRTTWVGCLKSFSDRYGETGYRFNTISPGQVLTPTYEKKIEAEAESLTLQYKEVLRKKAESAPLKKLASIHGVVKSIYFLLKSSGANEITAANLAVDGGAVRAYY
jgi:3-oxoacyl-[acyl-carrier protein] reductase